MPERDINPPPLLVRRCYLVDDAALGRFAEPGMAQYLICDKEKWTETFYDTTGSSLSNAECILKTDSSAPKYWKFFCFAKDNIMEITTDEQEIRDPLSRMLNFSSPDHITKDLLKPFFQINNSTHVYLIDGCEVSLRKTDFGYANCNIQRFCLDSRRLHSVLAEIDSVAKKLGMKNLAYYEPLDYIKEPLSGTKKIESAQA